MKFVPKALTRSAARSILKAKKNSPTIFFVGGIVGVVGSTVLACRATLKVEDKLDEIQGKIKDVTTTDLERSVMTPTQRTDHFKDVAWVYGGGAYDLAKLYGPAVILGGLSIAALAGSHRTLMKRNAALSATVTSLATAFEAYRERVRDAVGASRELDIYRGIETIVTTDDEGNKVAVRRTIGDGGGSPYRRLFDEVSPFYEKEPEYNQNFVILQLRQLNLKLQTYGHVFLNEAYDALGIERTPEGQVVGWLRDGDGDGYIDFGLDEPEASTFMNGSERAVWLDFNVDGLIYDLI